MISNAPKFNANELATVNENLFDEEKLKPQKGATEFVSAVENLAVFSNKKPQKKNSQTEREVMPKNSVRFDGYKHYMTYDDPNEERKGYRCKLCHLQANTYCIKCNVHLCLVREKARGGKRKVRNCFMNFHEINEC